MPFLDDWSTDDSLDDLFLSQPQVNKLKKKKTSRMSSSAPLKARENEYPCLVVFKRNGTFQSPFELLDIVEDRSKDIDKKWLSGVLNTESRIRCRDLKCYPEYKVSIYSKIDNRK